ncbi:MAG: anti-sigma factor, partial [Desulfobacterales bacterium]
MNCSRIKELFSEYMDGQLDKEREALVKDHLLLCGDCRDEFESMKAVVRELGLLDTVKAPDSFLADLHGRMEKDSWLQKIKSFFFIPDRFRIPVELATLATTVVLAFFIFHIVQLMPSKGPVDLKDKETELEIRSSEKAPVSGSGIKPPENVVVTDKIMPTPQKKQKHYDREPLLKSPEPQVTQALKAAEVDHNLMPGKEERFSVSAEINEPLQMVLLLKPVFEKRPVSEERKDDTVLYQEKPEEKEADKAASARFKTKAMPSMVGSMSRAEAPANEKLKKLHEAEKKGLSYQEELLFNIMENIKSEGGSILKTDINNETGQPEYLLIEIPGQNYRKFIEKLAESGKIQTQPEGDVSQFK